MDLRFAVEHPLDDGLFELRVVSAVKVGFHRVAVFILLDESEHVRLLDVGARAVVDDPGLLAAGARDTPGRLQCLLAVVGVQRQDRVQYPHASAYGGAWYNSTPGNGRRGDTAPDLFRGMDPTDVETVFVAGASGGTGRALLPLLGPRVGTVRALTRSPEKRSTLREAGADEVVVDDLLAPEDLAGALEGVDAVLSAVGSGPRALFEGGRLVDGEGTVNLLEAAVDSGVGAFVMESALGVGEEPRSAMGTAFDLLIRPIQEAKAEAEAAVREAPVSHTVLRPGILTNGARTDDVAVAEAGARLWGTVSRRDVARLMAAAPVTPAAANRTFDVVSWPPFRDRRLSVDWRLPGDPDRPVQIES